LIFRDLHDRALGNFQLKMAGVPFDVFQDPRDCLDKVFMSQLTVGQVADMHAYGCPVASQSRYCVQAALKTHSPNSVLREVDDYEYKDCPAEKDHSSHDLDGEGQAADADDVEKDVPGKKNFIRAMMIRQFFSVPWERP